MDESQSSRQVRDLRADGVERGAKVRFFFDGAPVEGYIGESVAAALLAAGYRTLRHSSGLGAPRGAFCWMGLCQECVVVAEGVRWPACRLDVQEGMLVLSGCAP